MIDHLSSYTSDYDASRRFYDAALGALGFGLQTELAMERDPELPGRRMCAYGPAGRPIFWLIEVEDQVDPRHVAFEAGDRSAVERFHRAALEAGGSDHGAPGLRPVYHEHYFAAFVLDPDGNNVEAVCHAPSA